MELVVSFANPSHFLKYGNYPGTQIVAKQGPFSV
jgi:hypothetical protein